jgi:prepilin signal peptidase PulO-like enzyme (type II secretory pathway)
MKIPWYAQFDQVIQWLEHLFATTVPLLPLEAWWVGALILVVLGMAAAIDAFRATVPDTLILAGIMTLTGMQGFYVSWPFAASQLTSALMALFMIWVINEVWFRLLRQDALGMGDAKWTMLAVACFGIHPTLWAWGVGACLAIVWMTVLWLARYKIERVYFAPFLFVGLLASLYVVRLRPAGFMFGI